MYKYIPLFFCAFSAAAQIPHITIQPLAQATKISLNKSTPTIRTESAINNLATAFVPNSSPGQPAEIMVQGLPANQTTVMIDDITVNTPLSGGFDISPLLNVSTEGQLFYANNIDIAGGHTGALLDLQTTQPKKDETIMWTGEVGTPTQIYNAFQVGHKTDASGFLIMMENFATTGIPQRLNKPRFGEKKTYTTNTFAFTGHKALSHNWIIDGRFRHISQNLDTHLGADLLTPRQDHIDGTLDLGRLKLSHIIDCTTQQSFILGGVVQNTQYTYNETPPINHRYQRVEAKYDLRTSFQNNTKSHINLEITQAQLGKNKAYISTGHFFHEINGIKNWVFSGALDIIYHYNFTPKTRFGLTTKYIITDNSTLTFTYKNGVRYPTLYDLFGMGNLKGNKKLESETSHIASVCLTYQHQGITFALTPFAMEIDNMIFGVRIDPKTYQRQNLHMSLFGIDTHIKWKINKFLCKLSYAITQAKKPKGQPNIYPKHKITLHTSWSIAETITWQNTLVFVGKRKGVAFSLAQRKIMPLKSYILLSSHLKYDISNNINLYIRGENLLNTHYENMPGWATRGRSIYAGFRMRF